MAAPSPTVRQTPVGLKLRDGFRSLVTFAADPDLSLWEMESTPGGYDNGEKINTTTFWEDVRTFAPRAQNEVTDGAIVAAYDPAVETQLQALVGREDTITHTLRDGSTVAAYGYLKSAVKSSHQDGQMPTIQCVIVYTNWDYVNDVAALPAVNSVAGT